MILYIYTDGGSRGNPGPAGFGLFISDQNGHHLYQQSTFIGIKTNNEAEYFALLAALDWIKINHSQYPFKSLIFYSDSQLLVRQIQGQYRVKAPHLKELYSRVKLTLNQIGLPYQFQDIPREKNKLADKLANLAMDQAA